MTNHASILGHPIVMENTPDVIKLFYNQVKLQLPSFLHETELELSPTHFC